MEDFDIHLHSVQQVLNFVSLATSRSFPVFVSGKHHRVNGKSFIGMFTLNLRRPVKVTLQCRQDEYDAFLRDAEAFLVK